MTYDVGGYCPLKLRFAEVSSGLESKVEVDPVVSAEQAALILQILDDVCAGLNAESNVCIGNPYVIDCRYS